MNNEIKIAIIGLGYVGLPLARLFATKYSVVGFDINQGRVNELKKGIDNTLEISAAILKAVLVTENPVTQINVISSAVEKAVEGQPTTGLYCTTNLQDIADCNYYIITVPTPVDKNKKPDLTPLIKASETVGSVLKKGAVVIYESTVYPGATEEICIPILEEKSGFKFNKDFYVGYSPERINPGDKKHTVDKILKVTSGSTPEIGKKINELYASVITAGTHLAPTIKVAEAAKVIENSQRDINIAFVNELAKIFNLLNIDTQAVLEAAGTKWNFLPFKPGLVGGHCIGVDPYYLAQKAQEVGYNPEIILAGRISIKNANILVLGITFKENCPDVRNTKVVDVISNLEEYGTKVTVFDPWADRKEVLKEYGLPIINSQSELVKKHSNSKFEAIVLAVAHQEFLNIELTSLLSNNGIIYDVKGVLKGKVQGRL